MRSRKGHAVIYERDAAGWWIARAIGLSECHARGLSIAQARQRLRDAISKRTRGPMHFDETIVIAARLEAELGVVRSQRDIAATQMREANEAMRRLAVRMTRAGFSRRDIGELLGVSYQRVQQLVEE